MSKQASPAPALTGSETEHTGELRRCALLLAAVAVVSQRRRLTRVFRFARDDAISSVGSPAACRDLLASLFGVAATRVRFDWVDATMPVHVEQEGQFELMLDADWILDPGGVVVQFDWCFTVTLIGDEIPDLLTRGLVFTADTGELVVTPGLLMRLRETIPLWHDIALVIEVA